MSDLIDEARASIKRSIRILEEIREMREGRTRPHLTVVRTDEKEEEADDGQR